MKKAFAIFCITVLFSIAGRAGALDFAFRFMPDVSIPLGASADSFTAGGGGTFAADVELLGILAPFVEAGFHVEPTRNTGKSLLLTHGGVGLGAFYFPIPRLKARIGVGGGVYSGSYDEKQTTNYYWKARAELGYRFSPGLTLAGGGEFVQYLYQGGSHYSGISLGLTVDMNLSLFTARGSGLKVEGSQGEPVFPIFYTSYEKVPIGTVTITNTEQAEIRNVEVSFQAGSYSSRPITCAGFTVIPKGKSVEAPLYASFNEQVLTLTENTKVQAEVIVAYTLLDSRRETRKAQTIKFNHRNATTWKDERMTAAFVSPNDPAVLEHSKYIAGLIRDRIRTGIDGNLQYGMGFFEGLRLSGIAYVADPTTPYRELHVDASATDYLQYPYQTLAYKTGDCDDLSILYAAALESVGIKTAFIPFADDFLVAFPLGMDEAEARSTFVEPSALIYQGGKPWLPVQVSRIREGFLAAWQGGAKKWNDAAASGMPARMFTIEEAWKAFQPVGVPGVEPKVTKPSEEQVNVAFENAIVRFISREIGPRVQQLLSKMPNGQGTDRQHNTLGMLYARYDMLKEARGEFEKAAVNGYVPALCNLGNVAFLEKSFEESVRYFEQALRLQPEAKAALLGLARAKYELDQFSESDALFAVVREIDHALADSFAYLSSRIDA
ncbi:MAG: tetratricopeptide repeat protein, partial [Spirochaetes bacterium]|nr:tetratricopeptide repeat protein [Spirochaetota bacterium]